MRVARNRYTILLDGTVVVEVGDGLALFDLCDLPIVESYSLSRGGYRCRYVVAAALGKKHYVHRLILGLSGKTEGDHRNRDPLDNRRSNLRQALRRNNAHNTSRKSPTTGYKGVQVSYGRYKAHICFQMKKRHIGLFDCPEEAARAYDREARRLHGEFAVLNFPSEIG
jgi:hypothetical protein